MSGRKLGIGVLGAHRWAEKAHLPGWAASDRCELVAICDVVPERAQEMAEKFGIPNVFSDPDDLIGHPDVELVDVCTPTDTHLDLSMRAIAASKHVLSEKPLARNAVDAFRAARAASEKDVRTKLGFTFRYSPAIRMMHDWIAEGKFGRILHVHGLEQNSQFLSPEEPLRQVPADADPSTLIPSSVVGYGSHLVDLIRWCAGEFSAVAATMSNFIPERLVRGHEGYVKLPVEDGTVALIEFESGAQGMLQTSYVAIGNYPGIELRVYGTEMAAVARLVTEGGIAETLHVATSDDVEFRQAEIPADRFPAGTDLRTAWAELYYRNLVRLYADEILDGAPQECTFYDGAKSQEIVDALTKAHFERAWISLPLYSPQYSAEGKAD